MLKHTVLHASYLSGAAKRCAREEREDRQNAENVSISEACR